MSRRVVFACIIALACGGQTTVDIPPSASDFPPPLSDAVPYDPTLGALADVPGGRARIGGWVLGGSATLITPMPCSGSQTELPNATGWNFGAEVIVAPFRLMTTEVTNRAYAVCVDSGYCAVPDISRTQDSFDWRAPEVAQQPVLVTWALANAFCRHYGGALPTAGEYARATTGDAEAYAQPPLLSLIAACSSASEDASATQQTECARLNGPPATLANVASDPNDVGAFGHFDLYGNAWEWTRGYFDQGSASFCSAPLLEHDVPLSFPQPDADIGPTFPPNAIAYSPQNWLLVPSGDGTDEYVVSADILVNDPQRDVGGLDYWGFRCAFPMP